METDSPEGQESTDESSIEKRTIDVGLTSYKTVTEPVEGGEVELKGYGDVIKLGIIRDFRTGAWAYLEIDEARELRDRLDELVE